MRQTRAIELGTGLFVLLGFAALFFLVTQITSREFGLSSGGYRLTASFEQVGGLKPGAPVSMSGVNDRTRRVDRLRLQRVPRAGRAAHRSAVRQDSG